MLFVSEKLKIPLREFEFTFVRSSGPGGQNVNKVNTKAILRWSVAHSPSLPDAVRTRFTTKYRRRISKEGDLLVTSQRFRDRGRNVADCLSKLRNMLLVACEVPKLRKPTRPSPSSQRRRRRNKEALSRKKNLRKPPRPDD